MKADSELILKKLEELGIKYELIEHAEANTMDDLKEYRCKWVPHTVKIYSYRIGRVESSFYCCSWEIKNSALQKYLRK